MTGEKVKVYVVEDEEGLRPIIVKFLEIKGYVVTSFSTADEALAHTGWSKTAPQMTRNLPDIFMIDLETNSDHDGFTVLKAAKEAGVSRIIMSGQLPEHMEKQLLAIGGPQAKYLAKPFSPSKMFPLLEEVLAERRSGKEGQTH